MRASTPAARVRALEAMGLGPLWVRRSLPVANGEGVATIDVRDGRATSLERASRIASLDWDAMRHEVAGCEACPLALTRTQTVFGIGAIRPEWLIIGEAPGADEDLRGEPFVGQAGKLLDAMLAAVGLSRDRDVFIANVLKCRPPGDRDPAPLEIESCRPYLERQVALLQPKLVLVVGKVASAALLGREGTMASMRGQPHRVVIGDREYPVIATYHPAYLLRSASEKAKAWDDLCLARETYRTLQTVDVRAIPAEVSDDLRGSA